MTWKTCLDCGQASPDSRCEPCARTEAARAARGIPRGSNAERGRGSAWKRISVRARKAQPWCSDCGSRDDLTTDHLVPIAAGGKRTGLTLRDVDVVCRSCNSKRWGAWQRRERAQTEDAARDARWRNTRPGGYTHGLLGDLQEGEAGSRSLTPAILCGEGS